MMGTKKVCSALLVAIAVVCLVDVFQLKVAPSLMFRIRTWGEGGIGSLLRRNESTLLNDLYKKCFPSKQIRSPVFSHSSPVAAPLNVTNRRLCFIHVGKTGGASFRAQFANGEKISKRLESIPDLRFWREFHTEPHLRLTAYWFHRCDYFVAWVRDPTDRGVSAYNMVFDPKYMQELPPRRRELLVRRRDLLAKYGNLSNLTEQLSTDSQALAAWQSIEHVKFSIAWYFTSDKDGNALSPALAANHSYPRLQSREFLRKLVFVGANECYQQDVQRFAVLFGISDFF